MRIGPGASFSCPRDLEGLFLLEQARLVLEAIDKSAYDPHEPSIADGDEQGN